MSNVLERIEETTGYRTGKSSDGRYGASSKLPVCVEKQQALTSRRQGSEYEHRAVGGDERRRTSSGDCICIWERGSEEIK
jgi:hypothetical protein